MKTLLTVLFLLHVFAGISQQITPREVANLPAVLTESSGLASGTLNLLWSHNDKEGQPYLHGFDTLGNLLRTITLSNATHINWEDLAKDDAGNIYIGDFGNNDNTRKDLRIYKIPNPASFPGSEVAAAVINFTYPDQQDFPPAASARNFDAEAMLFFNDSLYIFSKNRTVPYTGYTRMYRLPAAAGTYTAALVDSFYTGTDALGSTVTAADISPDKKQMVLLCYGKIICFLDFQGPSFFKGRITQLDFTGLTQKEAICFADNCQVYITDEQYMGTGRKLYGLNICPLTTGIWHSSIDPSMQLRLLYPNPASDYLVLNYKLPLRIRSAELVMYTMHGKEVMRYTLDTSHETVQIPVAHIQAGIYSGQLVSDRGRSAACKIVITR